MKTYNSRLKFCRFLAVSVLSVLCLYGLIRPATASAHPLSPSLLEIKQSAPEVFNVLWKTPNTAAPNASPTPKLPPNCTTTSRPVSTPKPGSLTTTFEMRCRGGLIGQAVGVDGLERSRTNALVSIELQNRAGLSATGSRRPLQTVVYAKHPSFHIPAAQSAWAVALSYATLGLAHIGAGADHLLFVFGLVLLVGSLRKIAITVTAFTVGHTITLSLAVLGMANVAAGPIEVLIAASVFWLAVELARNLSGTRGLVARKPWLMAVCFGLLHGLGFAGALKAIGLPAGEIPLALGSFNVGIELGQLIFVLIIVALRGLVEYGAVALPAKVRALPVYAMGSLAAMWMIQRTLVLL